MQKTSAQNILKTAIQRLALAVFGLAVALIFVEALCWALLALDVPVKYSRAVFFLPEATKQEHYSFEIPAHVKSYPQYTPTQQTFSHIFSNSTDYYDSDDELFFAKSNYSRTTLFFTGADPALERAVQISTDKYRRRLTHEMRDERRKQHLLLMGCSMIFGDGLSDNETMPWKVHHLQNDYEVYNLSFSAHNPSLTYRMINHYGWLEDIEPATGRAFYILMPFHVERTIPLTQNLDPKGYPYYRWDNENTPTFVGLKKSLDGATGFFQKLYMKSAFYKTFAVPLPWITETSYKRMAQILKRIEDAYLKKTGIQNKFYVILAPSSLSREESSAIKRNLEALRIKFIDYSKYNIDKFVNGPTRLPDYHPNEAHNAVFGDMLVEQLRALDKHN